MEERTLRCPNCGANATNHDNCEYCGSLLVRFVEKGIDLSKTTYLNDDATFLGLTNALKNNLQLQEDNNESVVTDIIGLSPAKNKKDYLACILRSGKASFLDGQTMLSKNNKGLCVSFAFHHAITGSRYNDMEAKRLQNFKSLDCFSLFTEHISFYNEGQWKAHEYFIDFGEDAEGASRLISRILCEVYSLSLENSIDCYTNIGYEAVENCREQINENIKAETKAQSHEEWKRKLQEQKTLKKNMGIKDKKPSHIEQLMKDPWNWGYVVIIILLILLCLMNDW